MDIRKIKTSKSQYQFYLLIRNDLIFKVELSAVKRNYEYVILISLLW